MALVQHFFDDDGQPGDIGTEVSIQFIVVNCTHIDEKGKKLKFPRLTLRLKHELYGEKFKMDDTKDPQGFAPACIVSIDK